MRRLLTILAATSAAGVLAPSALAGTEATMTTVELGSASGGRALASAGQRFTLVGLHWRGTGSVRFRTRSLEGRWSPWRRAAPEPEDGPDGGSAESRRQAGWTIGNPWWVGPSRDLEIRKTGRVGRVRAYLVWSPAVGVPIRIPAATEAPAIVPRSTWGANESIRKGPPWYAPAVRFAVVHHTAGRNAYTRAEAPAIVKAIQLYHVQGNGWNDIGYNFLVDRFGTIYEGRYGGVDRNVVGAHARGFNTGSTGIALLGTYGSATPTPAAEAALTKLLAWRLDVAHVDPLSLLTFISGGSERYASGVPVLLRAVSGHRDTGFTECPGTKLYGRLDALAAAAQKLGGPKIFDPRVSVSAEGPVRFQAKLSQALSWSIAVRSKDAEIARGSGAGTAVDWTWDATPAAPGTYSWTIEAGAARPAAGTVRAGLGISTLAIADAVAAPEGITPNGDGQGDTAELSFSLTTAANLTVEVTDGAGAVVATVINRVWTRAGKYTVTIDGANLADGVYSVVLRAYTTTSPEVVSVVPLTVTRTLGLVSVTPAAFSPNGDGTLDRLDVRFTLAAPATVTVRILRDGRWVASPLIAQSMPAGESRVVWDGSRSDGTLRDGSYVASVEVTDAVGTVSYGVPFVSDTIAPVVKILPGRRLRVSVSEPASLRIWINGLALRREVKRPGVVLVRFPGEIRRARVVAWDVAGNRSPVVIRAAAPEGG
jgi:hypothetical protein